MVESRKQEENLIIVATVEEYSLKHNIPVPEVLKLFSKGQIQQLLRSQYEVLHMSDLSESLDLVESVLGRTNL